MARNIPNFGYTTGMLAAIQEAIGSGVTTVSYEGKTVTYRSLNDMLRLENIIATALGLVSIASSTWLVSYDRATPPNDAYNSDLYGGY